MVMYFAPHILCKKVTPEPERDEYGRYYAPEGTESEKRLCECRCDDNNTKEFKTENGKVYRPSYKIVGSGDLDVQEEDEIVIYRKSDNSIRGKGKVYNIQRTNVLGYWEIWV